MESLDDLGEGMVAPAVFIPVGQIFARQLLG